MIPSLAISPTIGASDRYDLTPGSTVGAIQLQLNDGRRRQVIVQPKLPIGRVLFLVTHALDPFGWSEMAFEYAEAGHILDTLYPALIAQIRRALARGPLLGYRSVDATLPTIRGRVRFEEQIRRHTANISPLEVRHDDLTADGLENRLLRAALERLLKLTRADAKQNGQIQQSLAALDDVTSIAFDPARLPDIVWTRLNGHYRPAVELAKLILRACSFELAVGPIRASAALFDMNRVFEEFVVAAIRQRLGLTAASFSPGGRRLYLDEAGAVDLAPDLTWWDGRRCVFVGDVKYKLAEDSTGHNADLYQLLAYVVAAGVPAGLLIYAAGGAQPARHVVAGRSLEVVALDLSGSPAAVFGQLDTLADRVRNLRARSR